MRPVRHYQPFSLTLEKFSHDIFPGTDIDRNFSSKVRINMPDGSPSREFLIYMNNPLRYSGLTYYQQGFDGEHTTILEVVHNPSWLVPYISCGAIALGLIIQFLIHLSAFARKEEENRMTKEAAALHRAHRARVRVLGGSSTQPDAAPAYVADFGRLPVLVDGRVKPLDSVARSTLLVIQGRQRVVKADGSEITPDEWLLDVFFSPEKADDYKVVVVDNTDLLSLVGKSQDDMKIRYEKTSEQIEAMIGFKTSNQRRLSFNEMSPYLAQIEAQEKLAQPVEAQSRTHFQSAVVQLYGNLAHYIRLRRALQPDGSTDFLGELMTLRDNLKDGIEAVRAKEAGRPHDEAKASSMIDEGARGSSAMAEATDLLAIPPDADEADAMNAWHNAGHALLEDPLRQGRRSDPYVLAYAGIGLRLAEEPARQVCGHRKAVLRGASRSAFGKQVRKARDRDDLQRDRALLRVQHADLPGGVLLRRPLVAQVARGLEACSALGTRGPGLGARDRGHRDPHVARGQAPGDEPLLVGALHRVGLRGSVPCP